MVKNAPKISVVDLDSPKAGSSDEEDIPADVVPWRFAPEEELEAVANAARKARTLIHHYRRELWFVANANNRIGLDLPHSFVTTPESNVDALAARGGKGPFRRGEQWVVGRFRERARCWEGLERGGLLLPSQG
jgi:hypothetical protein